jgi:orotidine 5'-phosphate decarboxylase subfamily 1
LTVNQLTKKIFNLIEDKKTNLAVAADVKTKAELLDLAEKIGPEICFLKTHIDIITDFDWDLVIKLKELSQKYNFLILEDRKFSDIGNTSQEQYTGGLYKIIRWADIVTVHAICGAEAIKSLEDIAKNYKELRGIFLITELSCKNNLIDKKYTEKATRLAGENNFVSGIISQHAPDNPNFLVCTPGVSITKTSDNLGQNYNSPEYVIKTKKSDVIIVGRGIYSAHDPVAAAREYREVAWKAYQERLEQE